MEANNRLNHSKQEFKRNHTFRGSGMNFVSEAFQIGAKLIFDKSVVAFDDGSTQHLWLQILCLRRRLHRSVPMLIGEDDLDD